MNFIKMFDNPKKPTFSFEFFATRDPDAREKQYKAIDNLLILKPNFVSATFGAGGSSREGSYELIKKLQSHDSNVLAYFAAYGLGPDMIANVLDNFKDLGVKNVLCVRGDKPKDDPGFSPHPECLAHATDLLVLVNERYDFCTGAAGYPEGHNEAESMEKDLEYLELKVKNGAQYIITQYVYENSMFFDFVKKCRYMGINVPIIAGVMPIYSVKMMESLAELCGATITPNVRDGLAKLAPDDKQAVSDFGIEFAIKQCRDLLNGGAQGIHFYTMNRAKSVNKIVTTLQTEGLL